MPSPNYNEVAEKVILTTVYIWKTTYNPVDMDNRAYLESESMPHAITYSNRSGS
jgi:hypothetical protein